MAARTTRQNEPVSLRRRWPTKSDLQAWWILYKIANSPLHDLEDPEMIKMWFAEAHRMTDMGVHVELYAHCPEFRIEFAMPTQYSTERSVGIGRVTR